MPNEYCENDSYEEIIAKSVDGYTKDSLDETKDKEKIYPNNSDMLQFSIEEIRERLSKKDVATKS